MENDLARTIGYTIFGSITAICAFVFMIIAVVTEYRKEQRKLETETKLKLRALELGREVPDRSKVGALTKSPGVTLSVACVGVSFSLALASNLLVGQSEDPWIAAACVGSIAVLCGTVMTLMMPKTQYVTLDGDELQGHAKPTASDPDAFDVVATRG